MSSDIAADGITVDPELVPPAEPESTMYNDYINKLMGPYTDIRFHLPYLFRIALQYPKARILEIGTRDGNSTSAFLAAAEAVDGVVYSVDIAKPDIPDDIMSRWMRSRTWEFIRAHSLTVSADLPFDIVFLDGSHELYETMAELRRFHTMIKPGGRLLCHDTEWVGLDDSSNQWMRSEGQIGYGPVAWALDWFCREHVTEGWTWFNHLGSFGLGEMRF